MRAVGDLLATPGTALGGGKPPSGAGPFGFRSRMAPTEGLAEDNAEGLKPHSVWREWARLEPKGFYGFQKAAESSGVNESPRYSPPRGGRAEGRGASTGVPGGCPSHAGAAEDGVDALVHQELQRDTRQRVSELRVGRGAGWCGGTGAGAGVVVVGGGRILGVCGSMVEVEVYPGK